MQSKGRKGEGGRGSERKGRVKFVEIQEEGKVFEEMEVKRRTGKGILKKWTERDKAKKGKRGEMEGKSKTNKRLDIKK